MGLWALQAVDIPPSPFHMGIYLMLGIKQERLVPWFKVTLQKRKEVLKV